MIAASSYWDSYYSSGSVSEQAVPSQFATFIANECRAADIGHVVDIGCGSGRDSLFFAAYGFQVVGMDASIASIKLCEGRAERLSLTGSPAKFVCADFSSSLDSEVKAMINPLSSARVFYFRFFLHAIDDEAELGVLHNLLGLMRLGDLAAFEFRTDRDRALAKSTQAHFRRFVAPSQFVARASSVGLIPTYFTEGFGLAKHKEDDAHVARVVFRLSEPSASVVG